MNSSPWAKLTMSSTPKTSARPEATRASDEPTTRPFRSWRITSCMSINTAGRRAAHLRRRSPSADLASVELRHLVRRDGGQQLLLLWTSHAVDVDRLRALMVLGVHR